MLVWVEKERWVFGKERAEAWRVTLGFLSIGCQTL